MRLPATATVMTAMILLGSTAHAQIAVSAADGKQLRPDDVVEGVTPDEIAVIDLNSYPPKTLVTLNAPASMIGAPGAVAIARDQSFAIVTAGQKFDAADPTKLVFDNTVSVIDLRNPRAARVVQTVRAGAGAGGVAINRRGTLALVVGTGDDTVTMFKVKDRTLTPAGSIQLAKGSGPTDVAFTPDGKKAVVARRGDHIVSVHAVEADRISAAAAEITPGRGPYNVAITPDGNFAFINNLGGAATRAEINGPPPAPGSEAARRPGTVSVLDLRTNAVVSSVEVGATPETVSLSPDGKLLAVVVANNASVQKRAPNYASTHGLLRFYRVNNGALTPGPVVDNGHWCQGAAFSQDSKTLLVQCGSERNIEVYRLDGDKVTRDEAATLTTGARGGSMATAFSR